MLHMGQTDIILSGNSHYYFIQYIKPNDKHRSACRYTALPPVAVQVFCSVYRR